MKSIKLIVGKRYTYKGKLYVRDAEYKISEGLAEELLELCNVRDVPHFALLMKKRKTRVADKAVKSKVSVEDEDQSVGNDEHEVEV